MLPLDRKIVLFSTICIGRCVQLWSLDTKMCIIPQHFSLDFIFCCGHWTENMYHLSQFRWMFFFVGIIFCSFLFFCLQPRACSFHNSSDYDSFLRRFCERFLLHPVRAVTSCLVLSCLVLSCCVLLCRVVSGLALCCFVLWCLVFSCLVLSCLALSCLVLSCLVLSCLTLPCLALSCLVLTCRVLSFLVLHCLVLRFLALT